MAGFLTLTSVDLPSVDLSAGSATFVFTVGASDDGAGVGTVEIWFDKPFMQVDPNGEAIKVSHIALISWSDSFDDGSSSTSVTLSPFTDPGTYSVTEIVVYDILGNTRTYTAAELAAIPGVETSFTVTGSTPDTAAPGLVSVDLPSVDLSAGDAPFTFTVGALDTGMGVASVEIQLDKPVMQVNWSGDPAASYSLYFNDWEDSFSDGISSSSVNLLSLTAPGTYSIDEVTIWDKAGNYRVYTAAELAAIPGVETSFTVVGSTPDTAAPSLVSVDLPSAVDLSAGDAPVSFTVEALDSGIGVKSVKVRLEEPIVEIGWDGIPTLTDWIYFYGGTASTVVTLSSLTAPGTYTIDSVVVEDKLGNKHTYTAELAALPGVETSFTVTGGTPDTTAPSLVSVDLPSIDLSAGDAIVPFTVGALDTGAGVSSVEIRFDKPVLQIGWNGEPEPSETLSFYDWEDSFSDGTSSSSINLSSFTAPGTYSIAELVVRDNLGNEHTYTAAELAAIPGVETSFTVTGSTLDTTAPSLVSVDLPSAVDLSAGDATVSFMVGALDNGAGVSSVVIHLDEPFVQIGSDGTPRLTDWIYFNGSTSSKAVTLSSFTAPGTYSIAGIEVRDNVGNKKTYTAAELAAIPGVETSFTVTGGKPDTGAPSLVSLDLPSAVDLSGGDAVISFTVGALDSGIGVAGVEIELDKTVVQIWNGSPSGRDTLYTHSWIDSFSDGTSTASLKLSSFTAPGTYSVTKVTVRDYAGNERIYTAAELAAIPGVETSFTAAGGTPDTSKPNLVSLTLPSSVDVTNGAASFNWSAGALDTGAGVEWVSIKFDKPFHQVFETFEFVDNYILVHDFEDSFDDGQSSATVHLSSKNQPGTYSILEVVVRDRAGNEHVYTPNQIASFGGPTSLTLAGPTPKPPMPPAVPTTVTTSTDLVLPDGVLNLEAQGKANLKLTGNALGNRISGNAGKNIIDGGAGDDILDGGLGNDTLTGGRDKDSFLFSTKLGTSKTDRKMNFDTIKDFIVKDDQILLDNAIFKKLGKKGSEDSPAALSKKFFVVGAKAKDKDDYLVYNNKTGVLAYDADGSGKGAAVEFAQLKKGLALTYKDFFVI